MKEDPGNIFFTCPDHSAKPDPRYLKWPLKRFLGQWVKKSFRAGETVEHLWIKVTGMQGNYLIGTVDNDPYYPEIGVKLGDTVTVLRSEIEEIYTEKGKGWRA